MIVTFRQDAKSACAGACPAWPGIGGQDSRNHAWSGCLSHGPSPGVVGIYVQWSELLQCLHQTATYSHSPSAERLFERFQKEGTKFETKFPEISPKFSQFFPHKRRILSWQQIRQIFAIRHIKCQLDFHKISQRTSAGMTTQQHWVAAISVHVCRVSQVILAELHAAFDGSWMEASLPYACTVQTHN